MYKPFCFWLKKQHLKIDWQMVAKKSGNVTLIDFKCTFQ